MFNFGMYSVKQLLTQFVTQQKNFSKEKKIGRCNF